MSTNYVFKLADTKMVDIAHAHDVIFNDHPSVAFLYETHFKAEIIHDLTSHYDAARLTERIACRVLKMLLSGW